MPSALRFRIFFVLCSFAALALVLAACSGDEEKPAPAATSAPAPTATRLTATQAPAATQLPAATQPVEATATAAPTATRLPATQTSAATQPPVATPTVTRPAPTTAPPAGGQMVESDIRGFRLANVSVPVGGTVKWTNRDSAPHTATAKGDAPVRFNSGTLNQNQSFSFTFARAGAYDIFCEFHPNMEATVTVGGASPASSTSTSVPGYDYN